jgi:acyl carrier protein
MSEIAQKVKSIIIDKLGVEESEVSPEASFTNDLGADFNCRSSNYLSRS